MAPNIPRDDADHVYHEVDLRKIPSFSQLQAQVREVLDTSSWWDLYGVDWMYVIAAVAMVPLGLSMLATDVRAWQIAGVVLLGCYHGIIANKSGHIAVHGGLAKSPMLNRIWARVSLDFVGAFSANLAKQIHVKVHHPHTNIIGLGDSSTWRFPLAPRLAYMFLLPLIVPLLTPVVALVEILRIRDWRDLAIHVPLTYSGIAVHVWMLMWYCDMSISSALVCLFIYRAVLAIPYIHVNIFQHIGLPMYSARDRPVRVYQMATGCLNISSNWFLNFTFGHSLISCHVEHHLFPKLSDNMCLQIRPLVSRYLRSNGLPYNEKPYSERLGFFLKNYEKLMVKAPPITHYIGLQ